MNAIRWDQIATVAAPNLAARRQLGHRMLAVMTEEIRRVEPLSPEIPEEWLRETDEGEIRDLNVVRYDATLWQIYFWALANVRDVPLEDELRRRIPTALLDVPGVTAADEHDRESYDVSGNTTGLALIEAAARVVDDLADELRAHMYGE